MKKILLIPVLLILSVTNYSYLIAPNLSTPKGIGEELFKVIKSNDLKAFRSYYMTLEEMKASFINGTIKIPIENRQAGIESYKAEITDAYFSEHLDYLREHSDFEWSNATYETTEVVFRQESYADVYDITILFLVNGERKRIEKMETIKIKLGLDGRSGEKFVLGHF